MVDRKEQDRKNELWKVWYAENREDVIKKAMLRRERRAKATAAWLKELKRSLFCIRCSFSNPAALQFHHKDPKTKITPISKVVPLGWGKPKILAEIAKCEVLCANCHAIEHHGHAF